MKDCDILVGAVAFAGLEVNAYIHVSVFMHTAEQSSPSLFLTAAVWCVRRFSDHHDLPAAAVLHEIQTQFQTCAPLEPVLLAFSRGRAEVEFMHLSFQYYVVMATNCV